MEEDEAWQHRQRVGHLTLARAVLHRAVLTLPPLPSSVQLRRQARQTAQQQQQAAHASSQDVDMRNTTTDEHELDDLARVLAQSTSVAQLALAPLSVSWPDDDDDEVEVESDGQHQGAVMMDLDDSTAASTSAVGCQKAAQESQAPSSRELTRLIARALHLAAHAHHQLACQHQQQRDHAPSSTAPVHANSETRDSWFEFELPKLAGINGGGEIVTDQAAYHDSHAMMTTSTTADSTGSTTGRSSGIASLDSLQLCVRTHEFTSQTTQCGADQERSYTQLVRFHREATRDLVEAAEDEFHFVRVHACGRALLSAPSRQPLTPLTASGDGILARRASDRLCQGGSVCALALFFSQEDRCCQHEQERQPRFATSRFAHDDHERSSQHVTGYSQ